MSHSLYSHFLPLPSTPPSPPVFLISSTCPPPPFPYSLHCPLLQARFSDFRSVPFPIGCLLFVEGTRLTPAKLKAAQEFAAARGMHVPQHTLVPRPKAGAGCL